MHRHLTYANVMATVAVFIALGGASYAAVKIPANSVGSKQLRSNAVVASKIKSRQVTGAKVATDTLTGSNIKESTLSAVPRAKLADNADTAVSAKSAVSAASAATAANATHATAADSAANADRLSGVTAADLRVKCPAATVLTLGVCVQLKDNATAKATYPAARQACSDLGGRTPTAFELDAIRQRTDIEWAAGNGAGQYEWSSTWAADATMMKFVAFAQSGQPLSAAGSDSTETAYYRCVIYPSNR